MLNGMSPASSSCSGENQEIRSIKQSLVKYPGILHYPGISHAALDYLYPLPVVITFPSTVTIPTVPRKTFLHPSAIAFLPTFVLHLPMYVPGWLAARFLTKQNEEEAKAHSSCWGPNETSTREREWYSGVGSEIDWEGGCYHGHCTYLVEIE
jgi:hypothetical protein